MSAHERERLSAYLDSELSPAERAEVEAHLATCEECAALVARMGALNDVLRELPVEAPSGYFDSFPGRVRARLEKEGPSRPRRGAARPGWRLPVWTWAAAAALLLAVLTPLTWPGLFRARMSREGPGAATPMDKPKAGPEAASERDVVANAAEAQAAPSPFGRDAERAPEKAAAAETAFAPPPAAPPAPQMRARPGRTDVAAGGAPPSGEDLSRELKKDAAPLAVVPPSGVAGTGPSEEAAPAAEPEGEHPREVRAQAMASRAEPPRPGAAIALPATGAPSPESAETRHEGFAAAEGKTARDEESVAFARLAGDVPRDAAAWRERREAWRNFVATHPGSRHVDEARVRVIEAGLEAWRAGGDPEDLARARADAETYLARDDARLKARVRRALEDAETR
jgi:hypothetical protein